MNEPKKDNSINLTFLGIGDSESLQWNNTNLLIEHANKRLLIDCGWTAKAALAEHGLGVGDIDAIFITHIHGDHVFGLERFGFENRYIHERKPDLFIHESIKDVLWENVLKGGMGFTSSGENQIDDFFNTYALSDLSFEWQGIAFELFPTEHHARPSFGIKTTANGGFLFTADTRPLDSLDGLIKDVSLVFHDCTTQEANPAHSTVKSMQKKYPQHVMKKITIVHINDGLDMNQVVNAGLAGVAKQGCVYKLENKRV